MEATPGLPYKGKQNYLYNNILVLQQMPGA